MPESNENMSPLESALSAEQKALDYYGLQPKEHHVEVKEFDLRLRVLEVGEGPPLVIVPGGGGETHQMLPFMGEMSGYRLLAINRPGAPGSTGIDYRTVDVRRLVVSAISATLDHFSFDQASFVANSMGGLWTFWMALDKPGRIAHIVQGGCPALFLNTSAPLPMRLLSTPILGDLLFPVAQPGDAQSVLDELKMMGSSQEQIDQLPKKLAEARYCAIQLPEYQQSWHSMMKTTLKLTGSNKRYRLKAEELKKIEQPVLFIWGRNDSFGGTEVVRRAVELMPNAQFELIDTGHIPYLDQPERCANLSVEFLGD